MLERPAPDGPFGAKGPGEMCANPVLPAVANAVFNAVGVGINDLPITPEKILRALKERGGAVARARAVRNHGGSGQGLSGSTARAELEEALRAAYYLADEELSTAAYLALALGKPLFLKVRPAWARPKPRKRLPACSAGRFCACNATKVSTRRRRL